MKTIVFIGSNKSGSSYEAIKASESMLYYTVLLTDRKSFANNLMDFPEVHLLMFCDLNDINEMRRKIFQLKMRNLDIHAIVSFIDPYCHTAAALSREFGLKRFSEDAIAVMLDKTESREALDGSPYSPFYRVIRDKEILTSNSMNEMPLVLKAPMSNASKDVHMVWTPRQYEKAFAELRRRYPDAPVLVEKYLEGPQYLVETLTANGRVNIVAVIEQEITFTGRFIVTGYQMITDNGGAFFESLKKAAEAIIQILGMRDGPCHLELRRFGNEWKLIEANPRIAGGAMNLFIEAAYGINLAKETLKFALGLEPDLQRKYTKESFLQHVVVPKEGILIKVNGRQAAQNSPGVKHVYLRPKKGSVLIPPISMGYRYAYVIATGDSDVEARGNAKIGASKIKFHLRAIEDGTVSFSSMEKAALEEMRRSKSNVKALSAFSGNVVWE